MENIRTNLIARFIVELVIGIIIFSSVLIFKDKGIISATLITVLIFFRKKNLDEREYQLFYKTGHFPLFILYIIMFVVFYFMPKANYIAILAAALLFSQGLAGLIIFLRE